MTRFISSLPNIRPPDRTAPTQQWQYYAMQLTNQQSLFFNALNQAEDLVTRYEIGLVTRDNELRQLRTEVQTLRGQLQRVQDQYTILRRQNDELTGDLIHLRSQLHPAMVC